MHMLLFGITGMVGQSALRECLRATEGTRVQTVGRRPSGPPHGRLSQLPHRALFDCRASGAELSHDMTPAPAQTLARLLRQITFVCVSATGAASSEAGCGKWSQPRSCTGSALPRPLFTAVTMPRTDIIKLRRGIHSCTGACRWPCMLSAAWRLLRRLLPDTAPEAGGISAQGRAA